MTQIESDRDSSDGLDQESTRSEGRRSFLKIAASVLMSAVGLVLALPFLKSLITPPKLRKTQYSPVGKLDTFPTGQPVEPRYNTQAQDAFYNEKVSHSVWVVKHSDGSVTVFSPVCPHLGCHFQWNASAHQFQCPCHASTFSLDGKVLGGPAPRPLDVLPHRVENNTLYVRWVDYAPGIKKKVAV